MISIIKKCSAISSALILSIILFSSTTVNAAHSYLVTSSDDSGEGSLRDALVSNASIIVIDASVSTISINSTLEYSDSKPLTILGSGQTVFGKNSGSTLLEITKGADLTISNLIFTVNESFSITNQGGGKGIFVNVPEYREGIVNLSLNNVVVSNVGQHGIHVLDCDTVACGAGEGGEGNGSNASIFVNLFNVMINNVGYGSFDSDGVRIDDRSEGDIIFNATNSTFMNIGADGVELDEGGAGDVIINIRNSIFAFNGGYCAGIDVHDPVDQSCVEHDNGKLVLDFDDGVDIDEASEGSIMGQVINSIVSNNFDEGIDFDESGVGDINIDLVKINASSNVDEGTKMSEEDQGNVLVYLYAVTTTNNRDDGIQLEQLNEGEINVMVNSITSIDNSKKGLEVNQNHDGGGCLKIRESNIDEIKSDVKEI